MIKLQVDRCRIDKGFIIYIFTQDFNSSFLKTILIKNGRGNRPADAVATGSGILECQVLNPAPPMVEKDEMKIKLKTSSFHCKRFFNFKVFLNQSVIRWIISGRRLLTKYKQITQMLKNYTADK